MPKKTSLCFVCTGNTCRSPMAQFILKSKLPENMDLKITSFGTAVSETSINPMAKATLKNHGVKMTKFLPKQIAPDKVKNFDAIVTMTDGAMKQLLSSGYENVYSINQLTKCGDVIDPYGKSIDEYEQCFLQLSDACDKIIDMLKKVL